MGYRTKQIIFVLLLVLCVAMSSAVAWWSANRAGWNLTAVRLAHEVLALHLNLSASANDLFKQYADALLIGDRDRGEREGVLREAISEDIDAIRALITREIKIRGEEEVHELNQLARIERELNSIENEFHRIGRLREREGEQAALAALIRLLDQRIDTRLRNLIDEAVAEERREVLVTSAEAEQLQLWTHRFTEGVLVITLLVAAAALVVLHRSLNRPLKALLQGTQAIAQGKLDHRIALGTKDEFGVLAVSFNNMADELQTTRRTVDEARLSLESEARDRTHELKAINTRLAEQDALRRRFLADVSHELRTPLTVLRGEAEVALRDRTANLNDAAREALVGIIQQVDQMARLVDDLLFVARREAGEARLALRPVHLRPLLETVVRDAQRLTVDNGVTISYVPGQDAAVVEGDAGRLRQLFLVLLDNAVRYSPKNGEVRVMTMPAPGGIAVRVEDDGIGIPTHDLPHVFDRFIRGSNALPGGSGLGLPVARAIAEAHGGQLHVDSEDGRGTTVTLTLSLASAPRATA